MKTTTNYNLQKPEPIIDNVDITVINNNMDEIDAQMKQNADDIASHLADEATPATDDTKTTTAEVTRLNCLNKNLVSLVITGKTIVNLLGTDGDCEDVSKWTTASCSNALDSSNKVFGSNGFKITSDNGEIIHNLDDRIDKTKYYCLSAYIKNGNATKVTLRWRNDSGSWSNDVTDTTKFNRIFLKLDPTKLNSTNNQAKIVVYTSVANQYAYVDGIMIEEITAEQYNDPNFIPSPYVNGDMSVGDTAVRIKSVGKNLFNYKKLIGINGAVVSSISNGINMKNTAAGSYGCATAGIQLNPNTTYTLSKAAQVVTAGTNANNFNVALLNRDNSTLKEELADTVTFTTNADGYVNIYFRGQDGTAETTEVNITNIQMEEGDTATAYEEYQETVVSIPQALYSLPSGVADKLDTQKCKIFKNLEKVSMNNFSNWLLAANKTGYKIIYVPGALINAKAAADFIGDILLNYNNKKLQHIAGGWSSITAADQFAVYPTDSLTYSIAIAVANSESGWGPDYSPSSAEILAYILGYRMASSGDSSPWNNQSGCSKLWGPLLNGNVTYANGATATLPTALAAGFTPNRLYYQLAQTQEIDIPVVDPVALPGGSLVVKNDAQSWVRPTVDYTLNKNNKADLESLMICTNKTIVTMQGNSPKNNLTATKVPTVNDDYAHGYSVGSLWIANKIVYMCADSTINKAKWVKYLVLGGSVFYDASLGDVSKNDIPDITGGWSVTNGQNYLTKNIGSMVISSGNNIPCSVATGNMVDFTGYSQIKIDWAITGTNAYPHFQIMTSDLQAVQAELAYANIAGFSRRTDTLALGNVKSGRLRFYSDNDHNSDTITVYKIWAE